MTNHLFCFGYGYTAKALAQRLRNRKWRVTGTTRSAREGDDDTALVVWNGEKIAADTLGNANAILISVPPGDDGCPALTAAKEALRDTENQINWISYLSTNGVYGDHDGAWVDETSALRATSDRAQRRIKAEENWRAFADEVGLPLIIFRLPGIYGPGRSAIETVQSGRAKRIYKEGQMFSRMHVDDIAAALEASIDDAGGFDLFNLADDEPAPPQDVIEHACVLLGVPVPPLIPIEDAEMSEMARSFYADSKKVSNKRMKETLKFALQYPTYREGLAQILDS